MEVSAMPSLPSPSRSLKSLAHPHAVNLDDDVCRRGLPCELLLVHHLREAVRMAEMALELHDGQGGSCGCDLCGVIRGKLRSWRVAADGIDGMLV
jgi:hypothetical protein